MTDGEIISCVGGSVSSSEDAAVFDAVAGASTAIATGMTFADSPEDLWARLMFYEQIAQHPPLHLRWLLPRPLRVEGSKSRNGDIVTCVYDTGYLVKRVTHVDKPRRYDFEITEQMLDLGGRVRLTGGSYSLMALPGGGTRVVLTTRYSGGRRPRWLARPIEAVVCHSFHRFMLRAMRGVPATRSARLEPEQSE
jgi:hypothetical protein